jgi:ribosome-binding factor A
MERNEKFANRIKELSAEFLAREGNRTSLINVIHANCSPDMKRATIYITVLPIDKEKTALEFAKRNGAESNRRIFLLQRNALPLGYQANCAGRGTRTLKSCDTSS